MAGESAGFLDQDSPEILSLPTLSLIEPFCRRILSQSPFSRNLMKKAALFLFAIVVSGLSGYSQDPAKPKLGETQVQRSGKTYVQVYLEENFKGRAYRVEVPVELSNDARLKELGIPNDKIMSMKIPDGVTVTLYDGADFGNPSQAFTGKVPSLGAMKGVTSSLKTEFTAK